MYLLRLLLFAFSVLFASIITAQQKSHAPFILTGTISSFMPASISIFYYNDSLNGKNQQIPVKDGKFRYVINKVNHAYTASLTMGNLRVTLAVAPGYALDLTADGSSDSTMMTSLKITGKGSLANELCRSLQPGILQLPECRNESDVEKITACFLEERRAIDAAFRSQTEKLTDKNDPYFSFFKDAAWYNLSFMRLEHICGFLKNHYIELGYERMQKILHDNIDSSIVRNMSNEKYLSSQQYIWMIGQGNQYLFYYTRLTHFHDSGPPVFKDYLAQIDHLFSGKIKSYYLNTFLSLHVGAEGSYENFMKKKDIILEYANKIGNQQWKKQLIEDVYAREAALARTRVGQSAPFFALRDSAGAIHRLSDFKGKVILLDFWASWCAPCRRETPYLKELYKSYANAENIVFISIAVRDRDAAWKKAMREDKTPWLNLWGEGSIEGDYSTSAIPKFVVIDARGNVFDFDADAPSEGSLLKEMLEAAVANERRP